MKTLLDYFFNWRKKSENSEKYRQEIEQALYHRDALFPFENELVEYELVEYELARAWGLGRIFGVEAPLVQLNYPLAIATKGARVIQDWTGQLKSLDDIVEALYHPKEEEKLVQSIVEAHLDIRAVWASLVCQSDYNFSSIMLPCMEDFEAELKKHYITLSQIAGNPLFENWQETIHPAFRGWFFWLKDLPAIAKQLEKESDLSSSRIWDFFH